MINCATRAAQSDRDTKNIFYLNDYTSVKWFRVPFVLNETTENWSARVLLLYALVSLATQTSVRAGFCDTILRVSGHVYYKAD